MVDVSITTWFVEPFREKDGSPAGWKAEHEDVTKDLSIIAPSLEETYSSVGAWHEKHGCTSESWQLVIAGS